MQQSNIYALSNRTNVNENVKVARNHVLETGCDAGFAMTPLAWDSQHKGIDDLPFAAKKNHMK